MTRAAKKTAPTAEAVEPAPMRQAIKGFDRNLQCRGYQFAPDETYTHEGHVRCCEGGFHAIVADAHPLAVFDYYGPAGSRFCRVEIGGATHTNDCVKVAAEVLKVGQEVSLRELTLEAVAWVTARATEKAEHTTGPRSASTATGAHSASTATGYGATAINVGLEGRVRGLADGAALHANEYGPWHGETYPLISVACGIVGQDGLKPDTWYVCRGGKLVAV